MKEFRKHDNLENDKAHAIPGGARHLLRIFFSGLVLFVISSLVFCCPFFIGHRSPAQVLAEIVGIYCNIGKVFGGILVMLSFLGVNIYSTLITLGLTVLLAGVQSALHINEAFRNVMALVHSNAIHVGEIISLGRAGSTPADNPGENVTGFVEGVTWTHIIIRDFKVRLMHVVFLICVSFYESSCHSSNV